MKLVFASSGSFVLGAFRKEWVSLLNVDSKLYYIYYITCFVTSMTFSGVIGDRDR